MLLPVGLTGGSDDSLDPLPSRTDSSPPDANFYTLYFASGNDSGTDGLITTKVPDSGGQETASALDSDVEFKSHELISSMEFFGRKYHANDSYYLPVNLFLKATGSSQSSVDWTVTIRSSGGSVGSSTWGGGTVCDSTFSSAR